MPISFNQINVIKSISFHKFISFYHFIVLFHFINLIFTYLILSVWYLQLHISFYQFDIYIHISYYQFNIYIQIINLFHFINLILKYFILIWSRHHQNYGLQRPLWPRPRVFWISRTWKGEQALVLWFQSLFYFKKKIFKKYITGLTLNWALAVLLDQPPPGFWWGQPSSCGHAAQQK